MSSKLQGLCAVLVTPFDSSGGIDLASLEREVAFYLHHGASSLMALGLMGEGPSLSQEEGLRVVRTVAKTAGPEIPLVVGAVGMLMDETCEFGRAVSDTGASALMLTIPPTAADPLVEGAEFLETVSAATKLSLVLLDCPAVAPKLSVDDLVDLSSRIESFCAVKLEDNPTHLKIGELKARVGERLAVFGANGGVLCLHELQRGCDGFMTGYACPEHLIEIMDSHSSGDRDRAADAYARYLPLITYCWQPGIGMALRKEVLVLRGAITSSRVRSPHKDLDEKTRAELRQVVERVTGMRADVSAA